MQITPIFKQQVMDELLEVRKKYTGTDAAFAKQWGINGSVFSTLKNGKSGFDGLLRDAQWLQIGRELGISPNERKWKVARTDVFNRIEEEVLFCKDNAKAMVLVDDCELGKTFTAKYLSKTVENCFYVDCSQSKTKQAFIRAFAKAVGVESVGKFNDVKANVKYYLNMLPAPVVIIDEAGDLDYTAFLELKEMWNATDGNCGWYMMGADGLRAKIERGIANRKVGYREIFSRYSGKFRKITPSDRQERYAFYRDLITAVLSANCANKAAIPELVKKCLASGADGEIGGLRRAESLLILLHKRTA
jgi:hypothetical protein